jgi:hypothetical protein
MPEWKGAPQEKKLNKLKSEFTKVLKSSAGGAIIGVETSKENQLHLHCFWLMKSIYLRLKIILRYLLVLLV